MKAALITLLFFNVACSTYSFVGIDSMPLGDYKQPIKVDEVGVYTSDDAPKNYEKVSLTTIDDQGMGFSNSYLLQKAKQIAAESGANGVVILGTEAHSAGGHYNTRYNHFTQKNEITSYNSISVKTLKVLIIRYNPKVISQN